MAGSGPAAAWDVTEPGRGNPLAFVVGCPRSGTTLLQRMIAAHPELAVVPEAPWLATGATDPATVDADGMVRGAFLRALAERGSFGRYARLPVSAEELTDLAARVEAGERVPFAQLAGWLLDRFGAVHGRDLVLNKTVGAAVHVEALGRTFPQARIVHLVRDGRDVATSAVGWRRAPRLAEKYATWADEPLGTAALWWEWHVRRGREGGRELGPERYREIRYEELVRWPEASLRGLCAFLGLEFHAAMLDYAAGRARGGAGLDVKHAWRPVTVGLRDWRRQIAAHDLALVDAIAGDLLAELAYPGSGVVVDAETHVRARRLRARFEGRPLPARWGADVVVSGRRDGVGAGGAR